MKTNLILIAIIILLLSAGSIGWYLYNRQVKISNRHEQNYLNTQGEISRFKDVTGQQAVKLQETQLTLSELRKQNGALYNEALNLKVKKRQLEQLLSVKTETRIDSVLIPIHDTTIIRAKDTITRIASVKTKWLDVSLSVKPNEIEVLEYVSRDEVIVIVHWFKNSEFLLWRWFERKKWGASIKSLNPKSIITQAENIKVTKKIGR